jgi:hypothetical protein
MFRFNYQKYCEYRKRVNKLSDEDMIALDSMNNISQYDKWNRDDMKHLIILKDWCDYEKD